MPFDSPDVKLGELLDDVATGKTQLPDFQRDWKWDTDRIASLLASVSLGYPVGVLMMLEVGGEETRFKSRPIAGVAENDLKAPEKLMLDGQQRTTSLFQALKSNRPVDTTDAKGKKLKRWYYVDMAKAIDPVSDREEAIVAVPEDRIVRRDFGKVVEADYSSVEKECRAGMFPLWRALDVGSLIAWQNQYNTHSGAGPVKAAEQFQRFYSEVLNNFVQYTVPVIVLKKETPREAVCTVFEKVNTGGVVLNVFELLTATFAADAEGFRLNDDWKARKARLSRKAVLAKLESTDFLQAVSLVVTARRRLRAEGGENGRDGTPAVSCRRKDILRLRLEDYKATADAVTDAFEWVAQFLAFDKVFHADDVPYRTQMVPLAALRVLIGSKLDDYAQNKLLRQWFWCGVLGELYGGATETRFARDVEQVPAWLGGGEAPRTVYDASFEASRLETLRTRNSAAYKGIYALLMKGGARDWMKAVDIDMATFDELAIDIHHVFPRKWCNDRGVDSGRRDSIVNKTPLSSTTNRSIGGRAPSSYLETIRSRGGHSQADMDDLLGKHLIDYRLLAGDDFDGCYADRRNRLLNLIEEAMGKEVRRDDLEPGAAPEYEVDVDLESLAEEAGSPAVSDGGDSPGGAPAQSSIV
jgi:ribosomal protein S19E (S16A)